MPLNMRTHAHGQGYADVNFLIPELVGAVAFHKGPYFVRDGDFASAGSVRIDDLDGVQRNLALTSIGSFGYKRAEHRLRADRRGQPSRRRRRAGL